MSRLFIAFQTDPGDFFYCQLSQLAAAQGFLPGCGPVQDVQNHPHLPRNAPRRLTRLVPKPVGSKAREIFLPASQNLKCRFFVLPFNAKTPPDWGVHTGSSHCLRAGNTFFTSSSFFSLAFSTRRVFLAHI